ncbi:unnamed protein product [Gulo gulo]|uniref:Peptidyl-prolyl cis-trans isomerase n=1 Tax=Gulo gulo TaxID=48420 RepID=A0A9X9PWU7_GULGU|nr:unnamed protein product [Gulo gulo]
MALVTSPSVGRSDDENFILKHMGPSILSMASAGPHTNSSQLFFCAAKTDWVDVKQAVFSKVKEGMKTEETWNILAPGMARPARRLPLLIVDKSNKSGLCFILATRPFLL